jgi:hypothetical protein
MAQQYWLVWFCGAFSSRSRAGAYSGCAGALLAQDEEFLALKFADASLGEESTSATELLIRLPGGGHGQIFGLGVLKHTGVFRSRLDILNAEQRVTLLDPT